MTTDPYAPDTIRWDAFVEWARRFYEWVAFAPAERNYKLEIGQHLAAAREAFLNNDHDWPDKLRRAFGTPNNLTHGISQNARFLDLLEKSPEMIEDALRWVWASAGAAPKEPTERVRGFVTSISEAPKRVAVPEGLAAFLLMAHDANHYPYYQVRPFTDAYKLTGYPPPEPKAPRWDRYGSAVAFLDEFIDQAGERGLAIPDRLDAQSLVWCVTRQDYRPKTWPEEVLTALDTYRGPAAEPPRVTEPTPTPEPAPPTGPDWPSLAADLLWETHQLEEIVADLEDKRQMIFYGPPGTGKTYVAKAIAAEYARSGGGFEIVQFHPSYSYEDFVEGFRPALSDSGQPGFTLTQGPLRRIAAEAAANPDATYVLVIDELNRGNVAKVFGELYFLLEYRDEEIRLQYGGAPFRLPRNLLFICTMNTADRSIALMDAALRRRFYFAPFFPNEPPIEGLLRRWLDEHAAGMAEHVAGLLDRANALLDRDAAIGPSYFMRGDLDEARVRRIWSRAVIPYVEEQCFGDEDKLKQLQYDSLMKEQATEAAPPSDGENPDADADAP